MNPDTHGWISLKLHHHGNDKDRLTLELLPVLERAQRQGGLIGYFVQRHWWRGPHVRFNLRFADRAAWRIWREPLENAARDALQAYPSSQALSETEYLNRYAPVAALELTDKTLTPLEADNSWRWAAFTMREVMYGSAELAALSRDLLLETQPLFDSLLKRTVGDRRVRLFALVELMLHHVAAFDDPAVAALSFRSHAEAYFHLAGDDGALRTRFSDLHATHAGAFADAYTKALEARGSACLERWTTAVRRARQSAMTAFREGRARLPTRDDFLRMQADLPAGVEPASSVHSLGPRHQALLDPNSDLSRKLARPEMQAIRLVTNLLYDRFTALGVTVRERFLLCTLAALTVEGRHAPAAVWTPGSRSHEAVM